MKKQISIFLILSMSLFLSGCSPIGDKDSNMTMIYGITSGMALLLVVFYHATVQKKEFWLQLLFASILIVNIGYLTLAMSVTLREALLANRISYFGSVFLPLSMLIIILKQTEWKQRNWIIAILSAVSICMFFIAASPGYSDLYYASVELSRINGATVLVKEYGPLHPLYLYYLITYFFSMVAVIVHATVRKKMSNHMHVMILAFAVFVNIGVWLCGQMITLPFEFLSVSYIISGYFILALQLLLQQNIVVHTPAPAAVQTVPEIEQPLAVQNEKLAYFEASLPDLTPTEHLIYKAYLEGKTTREVMNEQHIKENTLKYHNKNIYSKLGVSSKKELMEMAKELKLKKHA